jgi:hypothetical protein
MRARLLRNLTCVLIIVTLIMLSFSTVPRSIISHERVVSGGDSAQFTITRLTDVSETEPNGNQGSADTLNKADAPLNLTGNLSVWNEVDWFKFTLTGGAGPVDNVTITPTDIIWPVGGSVALIIWVYDGYPRSSDQNLIHSEYWWRSSGPWPSMTFFAQYNGTYYLQVQTFNSAQSGKLEYELRINVTSSTPLDNYNDIPSATALTASRSNERIEMPTEYFDWYRIPLADDTVPTVVNMTVDVTASYSDTWSTYTVVVVVDLFLAYRLKSNPGSLTYEMHQISRDTTETGHSNPKDIDFRKNITEMYVGLTLETWGYDPASPTTHYILDTPHSLAWAIYSITGFKNEADYPNKAPKLSGGNVTPLNGRTDDSYVYSVLYTDPDGDYPSEIVVTVDSASHDMSKKSGQGNNYAAGVIYEKTMGPGTLAEGQHRFSFSARDKNGASAFGDLALHDGPFIDDNYAPYIKPAARTKITLQEDQPVGYVNLAFMFDDPDLQSLDFRIKNNAEWSKVLADDLAQFTVVDSNSTLKIVPNQDKFGELTVLLNATDGKAWVDAPHTLVVNITSVNDDPVITKVGSKSVVGETVSLVAFQGEWADITILGEDTADGDAVFFSCNIGDVISDAKEGENYNFDPAGTLSFKPSDPDVGSDFIVNISAHDDNGGLSWVLAHFQIRNENDPPVLTDPGDKSVKQYQTLTFTLEADDDDLDSGDSLQFYSNVQEKVPGLALEENLFLDEETGEFTLNADNQDMVGEYDVTFGVRDSTGANHTLTVKLTIENVNDPPEAKAIKVTGGYKNLTIVATTSAAFDLDGDELTYIWDFGDGMPKTEGEDLLEAEHTYSQEGSYNITLTVSDGLETDTKVFPMLVTPPQPPSADDDIEPPEENNSNNGTGPGGNGTTDSGDKGGGLENYLIWIILLVIILVGVIVIIIVVVVKKGKEKDKKKKKKVPEPEPEPQVEEEELAEPTVQAYDDNGYPQPEPSFTDTYPLEEMPAMDQLAPQEDYLALPEPTPATPEQPEPTPASGEPTPSLDEIFSGMDDVGQQPEEEPAAEPEPVPVGEPEVELAEEAAAEPVPKPAPEPLEPGMDPELADIFAPIAEGEGESAEAEPAAESQEEPQPQDDRIGTTVELACHSCGEMMAVEITHLPMSIVCWNCSADGVIE